MTRKPARDHLQKRTSNTSNQSGTTAHQQNPTKPKHIKNKHQE